MNTTSHLSVIAKSMLNLNIESLIQENFFILLLTISFLKKVNEFHYSDWFADWLKSEETKACSLSFNSLTL